ncbi:MAG: hypothetical protein E7254_08805 [Lachnospiraceae bacterium]|nr:hypothetical protein [Lachnospiraceae bacterium]
MGILSSLFGNKTEKIAKEMLGEYAKSVKERIPNQNYDDDNINNSEETVGVSYGKKKPAEENQFNFKGTYLEYFGKVFKEEFPEYNYQIDKETDNWQNAGVITFYSGENKALVVELLSEASKRKKLRSECADNGIPYLRFYYDHRGWWNTRSYVVDRTKKALGR